jgi:hypothetical protein
MSVPDPALTDWVPLSSFTPPGAMELIQEIELGADAASIDFQNILQTYRHLLLVGIVKGAAGSGTQLGLRMNNVSTGSYRWGSVYMTGSVVPGASGQGTHTQIIISPVGQAAGLHLIDCSIPNYRETILAKKFAHNRFWNEGMYGGASQGEWSSSAAINRLTLQLDSGNLAIGSRVALYGIGKPAPVLVVPPLNVIELVAERVTGKNNTGLVVALPEYNFDGGKYWIEVFTTNLAGTATSGGGGGGNTSVQLRRTPSGGAAAVLETWQVIGPAASHLLDVQHLTGIWNVPVSSQPRMSLLLLVSLLGLDFHADE